MFNENKNFLQPPLGVKPQEQRSKEFIKAYNEQFCSYLADVLIKSGLNGDESLTGLFKSDKPYYDNYYLDATRQLASKFINAKSPIERLSLLSKKESGLPEKMTKAEVDLYMSENSDISFIQNQLNSGDIDEPRRNILEMLRAIVAPDKQGIDGAETMIIAGPSPEVLICDKAETRALKFLLGQHRMQKEAELNIILDMRGKPLFLERTGVGQSFSCFSLQTVIYNGYKIRPGALFSVNEKVTKEYGAPPVLPNVARGEKGITGMISINHCEAFKFFRYSYFSIDPISRANAGIDLSVKGLDCNWVLPEHMAEFALSLIEVPAAKTAGY